MFKFLKRKNCDFHIKQMDKCLNSVLENYTRADKYLSGEGFGDRATQVQSANGAIGRNNKKLLEAYRNYCDGIEDSASDIDKMGLGNVVMKYSVLVNVYAVFDTDDIRDQWVQDMETFDIACKKVFDYNELAD